MKNFKLLLLAAAALLFIRAVIPVKDTYTLSKGYAVTINGTSNLHNWNETVETVTGETTISWNSDGSFNLEAVSIKMNVHSIKSDMGAIMNNNTYKALKAGDNPEIVFVLNTPINSIPAKSNEKVLSAKGKLTIAGVTKVIDMQVKALALAHGKLTFEGSQTINMTDYGVKPPVALFGTLKTGNEITINFKTSFTTTTN
jgi:polyisoprenoid-binding protein YceI